MGMWFKWFPSPELRSFSELRGVPSAGWINTWKLFMRVGTTKKKKKREIRPLFYNPVLGWQRYSLTCRRSRPNFSLPDKVQSISLYHRIRDFCPVHKKKVMELESKQVNVCSTCVLTWKIWVPASATWTAYTLNPVTASCQPPWICPSQHARQLGPCR